MRIDDHQEELVDVINKQIAEHKSVIEALEKAKAAACVELAEGGAMTYVKTPAKYTDEELNDNINASIGVVEYVMSRLCLLKRSGIREAHERAGDGRVYNLLVEIESIIYPPVADLDHDRMKNVVQSCG